MALRPPKRPLGAGFSVARRMSERARAARAEQDHAARSDQDPVVPEVKGFAGFEGMVGALKGLIEQVSAAAKSQTDGAVGSSRTFDIGGEKARMVFGYTLKMGPDGIDAEPFGNVPPSDVTPAAKETASPALQPIVEVFEDGDAVVVVAELPGADPEGIICRPDGARLLIETTGGRRYRKDLKLPVQVAAADMRQSYRNGILEVRLTKAVTP